MLEKRCLDSRGACYFNLLRLGFRAFFQCRCRVGLLVLFNHNEDYFSACVACLFCGVPHIDRARNRVHIHFEFDVEFSLSSSCSAMAVYIKKSSM